eukprot:gene55974-76727_t
MLLRQRAVVIGAEWSRKALPRLPIGARAAAAWQSTFEIRIGALNYDMNAVRKLLAAVRDKRHSVPGRPSTGGIDPHAKDLTMSTGWNTKYGPRRVRHDPPVLAEAITAAQGLTDDPDGQAEIAAQLMDMPVAEVRAEIEKMLAEARKPKTLTITASRRGGQTKAVVVERRSVGRPIRRVYDV